MTITRDHPWVGDPQEHPVVVGIEPGQDPRVLDRAREFAQRLGTGMLCVWVDPVHLMAATPAGGTPLPDASARADAEAAAAARQGSAGRASRTAGSAGGTAGSTDVASGAANSAPGSTASTSGTDAGQAEPAEGLAPEAPIAHSSLRTSTDEQPVPTDTEALLIADLRRHLQGREVAWRFVYTAGEAPRGLARVAREYQAPTVVVGSRRPGPGGWMNEMFGGSVAGHLSHTQETPVLVVPLSERRH